MLPADMTIHGLQIGVIISIIALLFYFHRYKKSSIEKQAKFEQRIEDKLTALCKFKTDFDLMDFVLKADCVNCHQVQKTVDLTDNVNRINDKLQNMEIKLSTFIGVTEKYIELTAIVLNRINKRDDIKLVKQE
ncbi:MAG: hypothetical protein ACW97P_12025 [Candidatus Hodarchaeales archaeon]|jgi:hypothetical protein